jgi:hypothetical protein
MSSTVNSRFCRKCFIRSSFGGVLALILFIVAAGQTAEIAFAQGQRPSVASAQEDEGSSDVLKTRVLQLPKGSYVEVRLTGGRKIEGRLGDVVAEGFMLQAVSKNRLTDRLVRFEEMQTVTPLGGFQPGGGAVELTLDQGNLVVGVATGGVNLSVTVRTPPKVANNVAAHVTVAHKGRKDRTP